MVRYVVQRYSRFPIYEPAEGGYYYDGREHITLRARNTVEFVNENKVKFLDFINHFLHTGSVEISTGITAVNIDISYQPVVSLAKGDEAFLLFSDGEAFLRLFECGNSDV